MLLTKMKTNKVSGNHKAPIKKKKEKQKGGVQPGNGQHKRKADHAATHTKKSKKLKTCNEPANKSQEADASSSEGKDEGAYVVCSADKKFRILYSVLVRNRGRKTLVLVGSSAAAEYLAALLLDLDVGALAAHSDMDKGKMSQQIQRFRKGNSGILVVDNKVKWSIDEVRIMIHYDTPTTLQPYKARTKDKTGGSGMACWTLVLALKEEVPIVTDSLAQNMVFQKVKASWLIVEDIHTKVVTTVGSSPTLKVKAKDAVRSLVSAYQSSESTHKPALNREFVEKLVINFGLKLCPWNLGAPINKFLREIEESLEE